MFERTGREGAAADGDAASILPAVSQVSGSQDDSAAPPAPLWREAMPGPEMIAALGSVSLQACTDAELLDVLAGWQRIEAWVSAQQTRALARTHARLLETAVREETDIDGNTPWEVVYRQAETEISTALRWTSRFTNIRLDTAQTLTEKLPNALDALAAGQLIYRHAEMICDETVTLTDTQAREVVDRLLPEAATKTVGGLRRRLRKACLQLDPDTANERAKKAATERSVTIRPLPDGQAQLQAIGPAEAILAMFRTLDETADRHPKSDPRTQTARRFDALVDFVITAGWGSFGSWAESPHAATSTTGTTSAPENTGTTGNTRTPENTGTTGTTGTSTAGTPGSCGSCGSCGSPFARGRGGSGDCSPPPKIPILAQITMDLPTLLGLRDNPAELHGYGPLPASLARALAVDAQWQRFIQDPVTGAPQDLGRTRRHPDAAMRRWIIARDRTCLFPECYRPAQDCEPDHNPAWEHRGPTNKDTLHQLCPKHHKVRHHGWHYQRHPGRIIWTSPHGQTYERYFTEADLIRPADTCPHIDNTFDDTIWPPTDEDQRLSIWLPKTGRNSRDIPEFRPPMEEMPWDIVEAFRLEDPTSPWNHEKELTVDDYDYVPTPDEEQAILDAEDRLIWGDPQPIGPDTIIGKALIEKARRNQHTHHPHPDDPPPF